VVKVQKIIPDEENQIKVNVHHLYCICGCLIIIAVAILIMSKPFWKWVVQLLHLGAFVTDHLEFSKCSVICFFLIE